MFFGNVSFNIYFVNITKGVFAQRIFELFSSTILVKRFLFPTVGTKTYYQFYRSN
jgi:hypothetical protein